MMLMKRAGRLQKSNQAENFFPRTQQEETETAVFSGPSEDRSLSAIGYIEEVSGLFGRLHPEVGIHEYFYSVCGETVRVRFGGTSLIPHFAPPLEHLLTQAVSTPSLTINVWDGETTGLLLPPPPWGKGDMTFRGEIQALNSERIRTTLYGEPGICSMLDVEKRIGVFHLRSSHNIPLNFLGSPFLSIFQWWIRNRGFQFLHAGAVGTRAGGVLLAGKGGSGKSTSALACLDSDLFYVSDDYCIVSTEPDVEVHSIYNSAKLDTHHIQRFPRLLRMVANGEMPESEKRMVYVQRFMPQKILRHMPLRAICLPKVTRNGSSRLSSATHSEAMQALAPSTLFQLAGAGVVEFKRMADFVRRLPSYWLELGNDINDIPNVIEEFMTKVNR